MNKKWFVMLTCAVLSATMLMGCNAVREQPEEDQIEEQAPVENNNDLNEENADLDTDEAPGGDENDTINKDDEKEENPDSEDAIEDPKDMGDENNKDE